MSVASSFERGSPASAVEDGAGDSLSRGLMMAVAWRFAPVFVVDTKTPRIRDLNLVLCRSKAASASSYNEHKILRHQRHWNENLTLVAKTTKAVPLDLPPTFLGILTLSTVPYFLKISLTSSSVALQSTLET